MPSQPLKEMIRETRNHLVFLWLYFEILFSVAESRWGLEKKLPHRCFFQSSVIFSTYLRQNCERIETCLAKKRKMHSSFFPFWCILQSTSVPSQQCSSGLRVQDDLDALTHLCWVGRMPAPVHVRKATCHKGVSLMGEIISVCLTAFPKHRAPQ